MKYVLPCIIALIFGFLGMSLFAYQLRTFYEIKQAQSWVTQSAQLTRSEIVATKKNANIYHIDYKYEYKGKTYHGDKVNYSLGEHTVTVPLQSQKIENLKEGFTILIDPNNPEKSMVDNTVPIKTIAFNSTFIIFPCFVGIAFICLLPYWFIKDYFGNKSYLTQTVQKIGYGMTCTIMLFSPLYSLLFLQPHLTIGTSIVFILNGLFVISTMFGFVFVARVYFSYKDAIKINNAL
jgi:Protein of unknown function (DUF3592)